MGVRTMLLAVTAVLLCVCVVALTGCGEGGTWGPDVALEAVPEQAIQSHPGGVALWVVAVTLAPGDGRPVLLAADSVEGVACEVVPSVLTRSGTVEVLARPDTSVAGEAVDVVLSALRQGETVATKGRTAQLTLALEVKDYEDDLADEARLRFEPFVDHLAAHRRGFGIDDQTEWEGWVTAPGILVVTWYSFLSADWEALIQWHVMIPPYDWTHVYLRRRGSTECTWAGEIPTAGAPVAEVALPEVFPRLEAPQIP